MSRYETIDRDQVNLRTLAGTCHDAGPTKHPDFEQLVAGIVASRREERPVIAILGSSVIDRHLSGYIIELMSHRAFTHVALSGGGLIDDFRLASGPGIARLNEIAKVAMLEGEGLGEAVGRTIEEDHYLRRDLSIAAAGWRLGVPVTCHVAIGADVIHCYPNCSGVALGLTAYLDFLIFAHSVGKLVAGGGVLLKLGSPSWDAEVLRNAFAMAGADGDVVTGDVDAQDLPKLWRELRACVLT